MFAGDISVFGAPGVAHTARKAAIRQPHHIETLGMAAQVVAAGRPDAGDLFDAAAQLGRDEFQRGGLPGAHLHLEQGEQVLLGRDQVDLAVEGCGRGDR